jgi:hypothetical protein
MAIPSDGTALLRIEPNRGFGAQSMIMAVVVLVAAPTAKPCTTRAAIRPPGPSAVTKSSMPSARSTRAPEATGRRPTRSESEPTVSKAASNART